MEYKIVSNYQKNKSLRDSFNELSKSIFGLDFEPWYQNGFWNDKYIPYSILIDNKIVSNVSVNICDFKFKGKDIHLIQLGTIMTDKAYQGKGLAKTLINHILKEYEDKVDGIYLFANDSVLDFYPKFGFVTMKQFQCSKEISLSNEKSSILVSMNYKEDWSKMVEIIKAKPQNSMFYMTKNIDLYMFYLSQFMKDNVFYLKEEDTYVIAETQGETLTLHAIFGTASLDDVIQSFGKDIQKVVLGFTPTNIKGYKVEELVEDDTTLFVKGKFFENHENLELLFPQLSRA